MADSDGDGVSSVDSGGGSSGGSGLVSAARYQGAASLARVVVGLGAGLLAGGFFWFGLIDAPIGDVAMTGIAIGTGATLGAMIAALISLEATLSAPVPPTTGRAHYATRVRRLSLLLLIIGMLLILGAATLTLNVKGTGGDEAATTTVAT